MPRDKISLPPEGNDIVLVKHDVQKIDVSPLVLLDFPFPLLIDVLLVYFVLHQGRKPVQQVQDFLLLLIQGHFH